MSILDDCNEFKKETIFNTIYSIIIYVFRILKSATTRVSNGEIMDERVVQPNFFCISGKCKCYTNIILWLDFICQYAREPKLFDTKYFFYYITYFFWYYNKDLEL